MQPKFIWDPSELITELVQNGLASDEKKARLIWGTICRHISLRLARRQSVDMIYFRLVPHPLHPHWPFYVSSELGFRSGLDPLEVVKAIRKSGNLWTMAYGRGVAEMTIACLPTAEWKETSKAYESAHTSTGYSRDILHWLMEIAGSIGALWSDYFAKASHKVFCNRRRRRKESDLRAILPGIPNFTRQRIISVALTEEGAPTRYESYDIPSALFSMDCEAQTLSKLPYFQSSDENLRDAGDPVGKPADGADGAAGLPLPDGHGLRGPE